MTIDEAIERAEDVAKTCEDAGCAEFHAQIAEWLRKARDADEASQRFTEKIRKLESENAKLRELVQYICDENYGDYWFDVKANKLGTSAHY